MISRVCEAYPENSLSRCYPLSHTCSIESSSRHEALNPVRAPSHSPSNENRLWRTTPVQEVRALVGSEGIGIQPEVQHYGTLPRQLHGQALREVWRVKE